METESARARYSELHKDAQFHDGSFPDDLDAWSKTRSKTHPYKYDEGVKIWYSADDLSPHDHFLGTSAQCPVCNPAADN